MKQTTKKLPYMYAVGRRKTASARVRYYQNTGKPVGSIEVNGMDAKKYFNEGEYTAIELLLGLNTMGLEGHFTVKVVGGGKHSQAEAVRHGIARLLVTIHPDLHTAIKQKGFLMRDPRMKERKKPGLKRARRAPQWAKR